MRTDYAVMDAGGLRAYQANPSQAHCVLPETLCALRGGIDATRLEALMAIPAAAALEEGLVSPAPLVIETLPCAQGSQRVTDATTVDKAQKKPLRSGTMVHASDPPIAPIMQGKSHGPAQCGRQPGIVSEPAPGCLCATLVPQGHPGDARAVLPVLDKVQRAPERVQTGPQRPRHAVAGDRGLHDPV